MDVGAWLENLGLRQYETAFRDNAVDGDVLPSLTADDLKEIGVAAVGHRRKLLDAIAALRAPAPEAPAQAPPAAPNPTPAPGLAAAPPRKSSDLAAERRPVTVLFCDLVGSTALAAKLDAEDWRDLVGAYLDEASEAVARYGGHVLKRLGDGLMALFGYPRAQENDAERAARAALAIFAALEELNARNEDRGAPKLAARIGLDTGPVVVDATGEVFGEAPNVAARAQAEAEPGSLLVTASVQRQIAGLFVSEDRGPHALKGVPAPVTLFRIVRASGGGRRAGAKALTPFVGRDEDLALLVRRFERARGGEGQFIQIVGEPGLGKSRLMDEFRERLGETPHSWVEWTSSQLLQNTPLHPLADWGRQRFGGPDVIPAARLAELEAALAQVKLDPSEHAALLAPLLDIPLPDARAPALPPEEQRRRQLAALTAWIFASARTQPLVLAFEDLHWADPTTLDLMKTLAERGASAPLLVVATARPEFHAPWATRSHHGIVSLAPLDQKEIRAMVGAIAERHALSRETVDGVTDRTGGVPLFVEEVTRLLLERGDAGGSQTIPPTLQQSLAARLDRLGEAREAAQIGAVLGREFSYRLLASVAAPVAALAERGGAVSDRAYSAAVADRGGGLGEAALQRAPAAALAERGGAVSDRAYSAAVAGAAPDPILQAALEKLVDADLMFVEGHGLEATYRFKHALVQDAAYDSLLKSRRQALHRRAAEALVAAPDPQPELVAHHFTQGGETEAAIEWWGRAGDAALRRSAFQEAIAHLGKAIAMADKGDRPGVAHGAAQASPASLAKEAAPLRTTYARAVQWQKGFAAEETREAYDRANASAGPTAQGDEFWAVNYGQAGVLCMRGEFAAAGERVEAHERAAEAANDDRQRTLVRLMRGMLQFESGAFRACRETLDGLVAGWLEERDAALQTITSADVLCVALSYRAQAFAILGAVDLALADSGAATARAEERGDFASLVFALSQTLFVHALCDRPDRAPALADRLAAMTAQKGTEFWLLIAQGFQAWARGRLTDDPAAAARDLRTVIAAKRERREIMGLAQWRGLLADLELRAGERTAALASVEEGLRLGAETGGPRMDAELWRLRGEALAVDAPAEAEEAFARAISEARRAGASTFHLRAALALARRVAATGRVVEAHAALLDALDSLLPAGESLSPGEDPGRPGMRGPAPDGQGAAAEARALLAALAESDDVKAELARRESRSKLLGSYARALIYTKGVTPEETRAALGEARGSTSAPLGGANGLSDARTRWNELVFGGDLRGAQTVVEQALRAVGDTGDAEDRALLQALLGMSCLFRGDLRRARTLLDEARRVRGGEGGGPGSEHASPGAAYVLAISTSYLSLALWALGDFAGADRSADEAEDSAEGAGGLAPTIAINARAMLESSRARPDVALAAADGLIERASRSGVAVMEAFGQAYRSWATGRLNDPAIGLSRLRDALDSMDKSGVRLFQPYLHGLAADLQIRAGDPAGALQEIERGLAVSARTEERWTDASLHRLRGEASLAGDPSDPEAAEAAWRAAIAIAKAQGARSYALAAALALARLLQRDARAIEAHAALLDALDGFPAEGRGDDVPELAEARALLAALAESDDVKAEIARREGRSKLQADYARAVVLGKGFGVEESGSAASRAREESSASSRSRLDALFLEWLTSLAGGDTLRAAGAAEAFQREAEHGATPHERRTGFRMLGLVRLFQGRLAEAREALATALANRSPVADPAERYRFLEDHEAMALVNLATVDWLAGDVAGALAAADEALALARAKSHPPTIAVALAYGGALRLRAGDVAAVAATADELRELAAAHGMTAYAGAASLFALFVGTREAGASDAIDRFRDALPQFEAGGVRHFLPFACALLAEAEIRTGRREAALETVDRALQFAEASGIVCDSPLLLRLRGDAHLGAQPPDGPAAEQDYRGAIALAQAQGARTYELVAALALAKLLQSSGRPSEAHAALSEALDSLRPAGERPGMRGPATLTPDPSPERERGIFPELAEAQAMLAALAGTDEFAAELRRRETRAKLHAGYALASMMTRGFAAEETKAALARVESVPEAARAPQDWSLKYSRIASDMSSGDQKAARAGAEAFVAEAERLGLVGHAAFGRRVLGFLKVLAGEFPSAAHDLRRALADYDAQRDEPLNAVFGVDLLANARSALGHALPYLGDFEEAQRLTEAAIERARQVGNPVSLIHAIFNRLPLAAASGQTDAARSAADEIRTVARAHDLKFWRHVGTAWGTWARVRAGERPPRDYREVFTPLPGAKVALPGFYGMLSDVERILGCDAEALAAADRGLAAIAEYGRREVATWLLTLRADALAARDPVAAEAAYREAVQVAGEQGSPTLTLVGALSLAKFLSGRGRGAEAFDALSPALEGFSPTPLFPPIAEARALVAALAGTDAVKARLRKRDTRSKLHAGYALATMMTRGSAAEETQAAVARAEAAARATRTPQDWALAYARVQGALTGADLKAARAGAEAFVADADALGLPGHAAVGRRLLGTVKMWWGDFAGGAADLRRALADLDAEGAADLDALFGHDTLAQTLASLGHAVWYTGEIEEAERLVAAGVARAEASGKPVSVLQAKVIRFFFAVHQDRPDQILTFAAEARAVAEALDLAWWRVLATNWEFWARVRLGERSGADWRDEMLDPASTGVRDDVWVMWIADIERTLGNEAEALAWLERAFAAAEGQGDIPVRSTLLILRANVRAARDPEAAEADYREAVEVAAAQGSPTLTLIAALALAKFLSGRGRRAEACVVLSPVLEGFSPTPLFPAIAEAQALVQRLADPG